MATTKLLAGVLSLNLGDRLVSVGTSCTVQPNTTKREGKVGQSGRGGYMETPIIAFIEGELLTDDTEINGILRDLTGEDVQIDMANGESYLFMDAWSSGEFTIDGVEGTRAFRIESTQTEDLS